VILGTGRTTAGAITGRRLMISPSKKKLDMHLAKTEKGTLALGLKER
jgi:hypothetical protein